MSNLLPSGFQDLTGASAKKHFFIKTELINYFSKNGYELFIPSLFQYDEAELNDNAFRIVDPLNNKTLRVRSDITEQIDRIYNDNKKKDLKLCYYGDVYYRKAEYQNFPRKLTQIGLECIKKPSLERDLEIFKLVFSALKKLKIKDITIVIALPGIFEEICSQKGISGAEKAELVKLLRDKNYSQIKAGKWSYFADFIVPKEQSIKDLKFGYKKLDKQIAQLNKLSTKLKASYKDIKIIFDPFDYRHFSYHTDFVFTIYSNKISKVLARGGCYRVKSLHKAIGASLYVEELAQVLDN